jgi:hypothetical protein
MHSHEFYKEIEKRIDSAVSDKARNLALQRYPCLAETHAAVRIIANEKYNTMDEIEQRLAGTKSAMPLKLMFNDIIDGSFSISTYLPELKYYIDWVYIQDFPKIKIQDFNEIVSQLGSRLVEKEQIKIEVILNILN